ncbi:hypothetical protein LGL08_20310 [Clostridium estertheticum]|uniref:phage tail fiber protein n=1 Tax=Clostridium estertheticum TaxID=238834 RepID=UPI001CF1F258|nr:hypothetical protein [Clostridium estertheticum]MCB2309050.1 hypothetical protein [Clostridium estertheticum]MCB2346816.1 hypothetical protein [Clostridium estertheticum]MCB2351872.1 hypothetical protein [Clostridium estertheticum]WAG48400.1 hypothetical protein LL127_23115 [Clostridium estertheticum]
MSMMSDFLENAMINTVLRGQSYAAGSVYVGLFTVNPTDANTEGEVTGASYVRQVVTFEVPLDGETSNTVDVLFPISTEAWGVVTHIGLFNAVTGGNMLFHAPLEFEKTMNISSQFKIPKNYLVVRLK